MPYTHIDILNQGLGKFSSSKVATITPPHTPLEVHCTGYYQWKESELTRGGRRWVFARDLAYDLPEVATLTNNEDWTYRYSLPPQVLRPLRGKQSEWQQAGRYVYSNTPDLTIPVVLNVSEAQFDPLFVDVLACRIWLECWNKVTQTSTSNKDAIGAYEEAVSSAAKANAFTIGPEDINDDDTAFDFITGRF